MPKGILRVPYPPNLPELQYDRPGQPGYMDGGYSMIGEVRASDGTCLIQIDTTQDILDQLATTPGIDFVCDSGDIEQVAVATSQADTQTILSNTRATLADLSGAGGHTLEEVHASLEARGFIPVCDSQGHLMLDVSHNLIYVRKAGEAE
jgi:hypothetical protein